MKALLIFLTISIFLIGGIFLMNVTYKNKYVTLTNLYESQISEGRVVYDEMWKVISKEAGVTENYSENFRTNYEAIMNSRNYGGEMFKWIQESNPNYTSELHSKLMNTIEAKHAEFTTQQKKLIATRNEIKNLVVKFPSSLFVGDREIPEEKLVTSTKTEKVYETGVDDNVEVFK